MEKGVSNVEGSLIYSYDIIPPDSRLPFPEKLHKVIPTKLYTESKQTNKPLQTNRWWQNFVLGAGTGFVPLAPYVLQAKNSGLIISHSPPELLHNNDVTAIITPFKPQWEFHLNGDYEREVVYDDDLSCRLKWGDKGLAYFVRGSPYLTLQLNHDYLHFTTINAILDFQSTTNSATIKLNNDQTWVFFTSEPVEWDQTMSTIRSKQPFNGIVRLAEVPNNSQSNLDILTRYSSAYPIGGRVSMEFPTLRESKLHLKFQTRGSGELLMLALPHHMDNLDLNSVKLAGLQGYTGMKGKMTGLIGKEWVINEKLNTIEWHSPNEINPDHLPDLKISLESDIASNFTFPEDPYFGGKAFAKYARLALISEAANLPQLIPIVLDKIKPELESWLSGHNGRLVYDRHWGGLVTERGLNDNEADFGNGWYNDHHFHYGYFLYACGVIGKFDPSWVQYYKPSILALIRNIANPNANDPSFPRYRHKDFYDGHSWAAGLYEFNDGRNQESSSEAINSYYGMYLAALTLQDPTLINISNLLLVTEIRSVNKYWHTNHDIYLPSYKPYGSVGVLWSSKIDYATWFGNYPELIHGIQMLPFTPISQTYMEPEWLTIVWPHLQSALSRPPPNEIAGGWRTYCYMAQAVLNPQTALDNLNLKGWDMDDGNTISNTRYWIATQIIPSSSQ